MGTTSVGGLLSELGHLPRHVRSSWPDPESDGTQPARPCALPCVGLCLPQQSQPPTWRTVLSHAQCVFTLVGQSHHRANMELWQTLNRLWARLSLSNKSRSLPLSLLDRLVSLCGRSRIYGLANPDSTETTPCIAPHHATTCSDADAQEDLRAVSALSMRVSINLDGSRQFSNAGWFEFDIKSGEGEANDLAFLGRPSSCGVETCPASSGLQLLALPQQILHHCPQLRQFLSEIDRDCGGWALILSIGFLPQNEEGIFPFAHRLFFQDPLCLCFGQVGLCFFDLLAFLLDTLPGSFDERFCRRDSVCDGAHLSSSATRFKASTSPR